MSDPGPSCPPDYDYETLDVQYLNFTTKSWKETLDHSKWGISISGDDSVVCFGDINRMTTQYSRGGGATCFKEPGLWKQMSTAVTMHNSCP